MATRSRTRAARSPSVRGWAAHWAAATSALWKGFAYTGTEGLKFAGTAIGEGEVDLPDCVTSLRQAGFDGWLNIEYEGEEDPFSAVSRSVDYTRSLLQTAQR